VVPQVNFAEAVGAIAHAIQEAWIEKVPTTNMRIPKHAWLSR
jgi:hypothetical protein